MAVSTSPVGSWQESPQAFLSLTPCALNIVCGSLRAPAHVRQFFVVKRPLFVRPPENKIIVILWGITESQKAFESLVKKVKE